MKRQIDKHQYLFCTIASHYIGILCARIGSTIYFHTLYVKNKLVLWLIICTFNWSSLTAFRYYADRMFEDILYVIVGFTVTYLSLEVTWHFSKCRRIIRDYDSNDKKMMIIKPCIFKQAKTVLLSKRLFGSGISKI